MRRNELTEEQFQAMLSGYRLTLCQLSEEVLDRHIRPISLKRVVSEIEGSIGYRFDQSMISYKVW